METFTEPHISVEVFVATDVITNSDWETDLDPTPKPTPKG